MSARVKRAFVRAAKQKRAALIPYITAGDPDSETTVRIVRALERGGADIVELGVPFTDPIADGPVNQRAAERALRSGTTLSSVLGVVREVRYTSEIPVVLFTYYNPVHAYGLSRFAVDAAAAGVDAVLFTDVPSEEAGPVAEALRRVEIDLVPLIAPTSTRPRIRAAGKLAGELVYFIARTGVTGARSSISDELVAQVRQVRKSTGRRVAVGFGIATPDQVHAAARHADGVVVGSALVERIAALGGRSDLDAEIEAFARSLSMATRRA